MAGDGVPGDDARSTVGLPLTGVQLTEDGLRFGSAAIFQLFESIPVAIGITAGPHHRFVYANAHYRRALMLGAADPVGHEMRNALGDFLRPDIYALRDRVLAEGRPLKSRSRQTQPRRRCIGTSPISRSSTRKGRPPAFSRSPST